MIALAALTSVAVSWSIAMARGERVTGQQVSWRVGASSGLLAIEERGVVGRRFRSIEWLESLRADDTPEEVAAKRSRWRELTDGVDPRGLVDRMTAWGEWGGLDRDDRNRPGRWQWAFGWPCVCLWYERNGSYSPFGAPMTMSGGIDVTKLMGRTRSAMFAEAALPLRVGWGGMVFNVLVYGAAWWGVLRLVSRWRTKRLAGRCLACGYDLAGLPAGGVCPECGGASAA